MTKTNSNRPEQPTTERSEPNPGESSARTVGRERVRELLQSEIDKLGPLEETRLAAALIGETSIRVTDEPGTPGFVIVGPDGQPRMSLKDGHPVPFTLQDLAAELRKNYPTLFNPAASTDASVPPGEREAVPAPRDWLMVGSGDPEPRLDAEVRPELRTDADARQDALVQQPVKGETSNILPEPTDLLHPANVDPKDAANVAPMAIAVRPSYAIYAGIVILIGIALAFIFSGPGSDTGPSSAPGQQATLRPPTGPPSSETSTPAQPSSSGAKPPLAVSGIPEVIDTSTLNVDGKIVRLFGVEWERGAQAEDLTRYIAGRQVACAPAVRSDRYRCQIEGRDLSEVILYNGGGRATHEATPELKAAEEKARASGIGVWQKP
jgi:endonuclease YncB( thermonuclease family)